MSLPKVHRLKDRRDFNEIYRKGLRRSTRHLILRAVQLSQSDCSGFPNPKLATSECDSPPSTPTKIGVSISQKVSKRAVARNRLKRQIQAAFRHLLPDIDPGWHLVVVVKPEALQCDYSKILQELKQLLIKAEVIDGHS